MNIKLKCPHDWRDIESNKAWSKDVRENCERIGLKVKHSKYGESFFYTRDGELRGCGYHRFIDCGCQEVTLEELKAMANDLRTQLSKREPMDLRDVDIPHGTIVLER